MVVGSDRYKSCSERDKHTDGKTGSDFCGHRRTDIPSKILNILPVILIPSFILLRIFFLFLVYSQQKFSQIDCISGLYCISHYIIFHNTFCISVTCVCWRLGSFIMDSEHNDFCSFVDK